MLRCSSGNMSARLENGLVAISSTGSWVGEIEAEQVAVCKLEDGQCVNNLKPTVEINFHLGILKKRADVNVVLHYQSPYATAIACGKPEKHNYAVIIETPLYNLNEPEIVDYFAPGSKQLADAVVNAFNNCDIAILKNHGLVTVGKNYNDVIRNACFFELACQILCIEKNPTALTSEQAAALGKAYQKKS